MKVTFADNATGRAMKEAMKQQMAKPEYITVKLTKDQIRAVREALEADQNNDYPKSDPDNRFIQRIIDKLNKSIIASFKQS